MRKYSILNFGVINLIKFKMSAILKIFENLEKYCLAWRDELFSQKFTLITVN